MGVHTPSWLDAAAAAVDCSLAGRYHRRRNSINSLNEAELDESDSATPTPYSHSITAATTVGHNSMPNPPALPLPGPHPRPGSIPAQPHPQPPTPPDAPPTPPRSTRQRPSTRCALAVLAATSLLDGDGEFPWLVTYPTPRPPPSPRPYPRPGPGAPHPPPGTLTPPPSP